MTSSKLQQSSNLPLCYFIFTSQFQLKRLVQLRNFSIIIELPKNIYIYFFFHSTMSSSYSIFFFQQACCKIIWDGQLKIDAIESIFSYSRSNLRLQYNFILNILKKSVKVALALSGLLCTLHMLIQCILMLLVDQSNHEVDYSIK